MGSRTVHMCISVRSVLAKPAREFKKVTAWLLKEDGSRHTADSLREALFDELAQGHEVLPMADCDDFDWKTGCRGHPKEGA